MGAVRKQAGNTPGQSQPSRGRNDEERREFLFQVYQRLFASFGPRHWWPAETPLEVCLGAILTQNVAWRNVKTAIANLKEKGLLDWDNLRDASFEEIAPLIVPTRYYQTKARKVLAFVRFVEGNYGFLDRMLQEDLETIRPRLLTVWGLGPETVDAILLYAAEKPTFVVDAYTRRVFSRLGRVTANVSYEHLRAFFQEVLPVDVALYNEYHALLDALGHGTCLSRQPRCPDCPLLELCPGQAAFTAVPGPGAAGQPVARLTR